MTRTHADLPALQRRFDRALEAVGATDAGGRVFDDLCRRHAEPQRRYHTLEHVDAALAWLDWFAGCADHRAEVELALWFHDAVYEPTAPDNERLSADLAREQLTELGASEPAIERVVAGIDATRTHQASSRDAQLVVDLDLTILGAKRETYEAFEQAVAWEFRHVPQDAYTAGRAAVLRRFYERTAIYQTAPMNELLEVRARKNLARSLAAL